MSPRDVTKCGQQERPGEGPGGEWVGRRDEGSRAGFQATSEPENQGPPSGRGVVGVGPAEGGRRWAGRARARGPASAGAVSARPRDVTLPRQDEEEPWKMSPSAFLPTVEKGNRTYKGQSGERAGQPRCHCPRQAPGRAPASGEAASTQLGARTPSLS